MPGKHGYKGPHAQFAWLLPSAVSLCPLKIIVFNDDMIKF